MGKKLINNDRNMRLIRSKMAMLGFTNLAELGDYLYMSEPQLRGKLNGKIKARISDIEYIEQKLEIKFDWRYISKIDNKFCLFYTNNEEGGN